MSSRASSTTGTTTWRAPSCDAAARPCPTTRKLLLVEPVLPGENGPAAELSVVLSDLNMLVMAGGRERTEAEYAALLDSAGLELTRVGEPLTPTHFQVLEAVLR
ncbi:methyltransferase [Streptomyces sp. P17]|uniref:methyltransferase n=1 Tax=Streptomyces sp. P17 TaxID=3074716 RepID=UPI0037DC2C46